MYSRNVNGQVLSFGVSGKLIRNTLVMYDRETESLWGQILGEAIEGPLAGSRLTFVPAVHVTWSEWRTQHPDTLALVKGYTGQRGAYRSYFNSPSAGVLGESTYDARLYPKEFVVGVEGEQETVAYPFSVLNLQPVLNDTLDGVTPIVVVFDVESGGAAVWRRQLAGQPLTFSQDATGRLQDEETNSIWDGFTGRAVSGPAAGEQLQAVKFTRVFWFGWKDWYPQTRLYTLPTE